MKKRSAFILILIIVSVVSIYLILHWIQNPAIASTKNDSNSDNSFTLGKNTNLVSFETSYFTTSITNSMIIKSSFENKHNSIIGSYLFKNKQITYI